MAHLVAEEAAHERVDAAVERRAEQHALAALRGRGEDAGDAGQEAEVGHVVGLVEHGDLDAVEAHDALLHEVFEPAGAGDDDVDAVAQRRLLRLLADAAEDRGDVEAGGRGEGLEGRGDLRRELAGRGEDEAAGAARGAAGGRLAAQARDEGQRERDGLAAAGAAAAEHVATGEGVGKRVDLDGEGLGDAGGDERVARASGTPRSRKEGMEMLSWLHARGSSGSAEEWATARDRASVRRSKRRRGSEGRES